MRNPSQLKGIQVNDLRLDHILKKELFFDWYEYSYLDSWIVIKRGPPGCRIRYYVPGKPYIKLKFKVFGKYKVDVDHWISSECHPEAWIPLFYANNSEEFLKFGINIAIIRQKLPFQHNQSYKNNRCIWTSQIVGQGIILKRTVEAAFKCQYPIDFGEAGRYIVGFCVRAKPSSLLNVDNETFVVRNQEDVRPTAVIMRPYT